MKNLFFEYYNPTDEQIKEIWTNGIIIFDTNVLINLYRYTEKTRNDFFEVLEQYKDRLWIPYQVALEYQRNRISVISKLDVAYDQIASRINRELDKFITALKLDDFKRHPYIDINSIVNHLQTCANILIENLREKNTDTPDYLQKDEILEIITNIFDNKVGADFTEDELKNIYIEGKTRYQTKTPPGYCDEKEKKEFGDRRLYGDLIVWKQIIHEAKKIGKDILLVTDDLKEDWWKKEGGKTIGPRNELIKEFHNETQKNIIIYNADRFLKYAQENMSVEIEKETIEEVKNTRKEDESILNILSSPTIENYIKTKEASAVEHPWGSAKSLAEFLVTNKTLSNEYLIESPTEKLYGLTKPISEAISIHDYLKSPTEELYGLTKPISEAISMHDYLKSPTEKLYGLTKPISEAISMHDYLKSPTEKLYGLTKPISEAMSIHDYLKSPTGELYGLPKPISEAISMHDYFKSPTEELYGLTKPSYINHFAKPLDDNPLLKSIIKKDYNDFFKE